MNIDIPTTINVIAGIATVAAFVVSIVQTIRYKSSQSNLKQLQRSRNATIWHGISLVLSAYESIEDARELVFDDDNPNQKALLYAKISSARRSMVSQYLHLLTEAVLDEEEFTEHTVKEWQRTGRLENEWRTAQAMKFVQVKPRQDYVGGTRIQE